MKPIKFKFMVIIWSVLLIVSCTNPVKNYASNFDNPKEKQVVVKSFAQSKITSKITNSEIIDGWLKKSITQQVIIDKIGNPEKKGEDVYLESIGTYAQTWVYSSLGIVLEMESENQGGNKIVRSITISQPCKLTTSQGISIGSNANIIRKKYKKLIDYSNSDKNGIVVGSIYDGTIFTLKEGVVVEIFIGAAAE